MILKAALFVSLLSVFSWYTLWHLPGTELADFNVYREAALALWRGENMYGVGYGVSQREVDLTLGYLYPPLLAALIAWTEACLPNLLVPLWCLLLFVSTLLSIVALQITVAALRLRPPPSPSCDTPLRPLLSTGTLVLAWPPLWDGLMWGQVNPVLFALLCGAAACCLKGRFFLAGSMIALAAALKGTPAILALALLLVGCWRGVAGFVVSGAIAAALSTLSPRGTLVLVDYLQALQTFSSAPLSIDPFYDYGLQKLFGLIPAKVCTLVLLLGYVAALRGIVGKHFRSDPRVATAIGINLGIPIMMLASPALWFHHLLWILLPLCLAYTLWGTSEEGLQRGLYRGGLAALWLFLGASLYLHVVVRHHIGVGEQFLKALVPAAIAFVFLGLILGISRSQYIQYIMRRKLQ